MPDSDHTSIVQQDKQVDRRLRVFVHLAHGFDARVWEEKWRDGRLLGLNERTPYGYHHAERFGCDVTFSKDVKETPVHKLFRGGWRVLLGFDLVHAFRNRAAIMAADVVWTHTESQYLSILAMMKMIGAKRRPKLICQSVWLIDSWDKLSAAKKNSYRRLIADADLLTFLSPMNRDRARELFPEKRCEFVPFGINAQIQAPPVQRPADGRFKVLAVGNDRHRDWPTLIEALGRRDEFELRIASQTIDPALVANIPNVKVLTPSSNAELKELFVWADAMALPLRPNLHASGITVLEEAALFGRPVVCTKVGGIEAYFDGEMVRYVGAGSADELRRALIELRDSPAEALAMAQRMQSHMSEQGLSSVSYVRRHVELSRELLA